MLLFVCASFVLQISGLGYTGSAPSDSGKFTAEISLWIAVASVPFALFAWIFNMVACCWWVLPPPDFLSLTASPGGVFSRRCPLLSNPHASPALVYAIVGFVMLVHSVRRRPKKSKDEDNYNRPPGSLPRHSTGPSFSSSDKAGTEMYQPKAFS